jgi:hypothetical protein
MCRLLSESLWFMLFTVLVYGGTALAPRPRVYRYFAFGSNVLPSTMTALRNLKPIDSTAGILPNYELRFDGGAGIPGIEPSAAFANSRENATVHGVLYTLTPEDFAQVGRTEGVPFAYRWRRCQVHPYVGDGESAGHLAMETLPLIAFTLVSPSLGAEDTPPSSSYLGIIQEGARQWKFDRDYQHQLEATPTAKHLIIPQGVSGLLLWLAELRAGISR